MKIPSEPPPVPLPDSHYLEAAIGWLMLSDVVEARAEFEQVATVTAGIRTSCMWNGGYSLRRNGGRTLSDREGLARRSVALSGVSQQEI